MIISAKGRSVKPGGFKAFTTTCAPAAALATTVPRLQTRIVQPAAGRQLGLSQPTLGRHIADLESSLGTPLFPRYLDRKGRPQTREELQTHDVIGFDRSDLMGRMMANLGLSIPVSAFSVRTDDQVVYWNLVRAGCGIGIGIGGGQRLVGDPDPGAKRVAAFLALPALPVWLTAPEALRQNARIRRVIEPLAVEFRGLPKPAD